MREDQESEVKPKRSVFLFLFFHLVFLSNGVTMTTVKGGTTPGFSPPIFKKSFSYDNERTRQRIDKDKSPQKIPKVELYERKVIMCVLLDHRGIIQFEFNSDVYSREL